MLNLLKSSDKRISEPPTKEVTTRFFTIKIFLSTATEDGEQTTEPQCFLCSGTFSPNLKTNKTLAIRISLGTIVKQYAVFHEGCLDTAWRLFEAFFQEFLYNYLFEEGLDLFVKKGYNSHFEIIDLKE